MVSERFLCIHGHFYQPPRENPWLEMVEVQDSARPYHDWNERITMECYGPNSAARVSAWDAKILDIRNNYQKISFNFGPTLLQWMELNRPQVYEDIIEADRHSVIHRNGHGNALAQPFNHTILPLATEREKLVQITWGLEDFRERFGRDAEGMWLPECAVDLKTLEAMASLGVLFTVLAPRQARRFRVLDDNAGWLNCEGGRIDPTRPYICTLPSGRTITLFFYDGPISQGVAFEGLLNDGNTFAHRLMQGFSNERQWPQLMSIATDGESYGHHHKHGEMALSYAIHVIEREGWARLTNYAEFLAMCPPTAEVQPWNNSSWSCVHGIERWRSNCGCHSGGRGDWQQAWRTPLRDAFRYLATEADQFFNTEAVKYFHDPQQALLDYIEVLLNRRPEAYRQFLTEHARRDRDYVDSVAALRLLEIMRNSQLMFTSCAWFFDEISGLETVQNMKYAGRLIQLMRPHVPELEQRFLDILEKAKSNVGDIRNGAEVYRRLVKPHIIDLYRVVAHHAITTFDETAEGFHLLCCYELHERDSVVSSFGGTRLKLCRISALSLIDGEQIDTTAVVLHHGGSDFRCSIAGALPFNKFEEVRAAVLNSFRHQSITQLIRTVDEHFGHDYHTLQHVFAEGRRELLQRITMESFRRFDDSITLIYEENRKFMDYLLEAGAPLPQGFLSAADFVLKTRLLDELDRFLRTGNPDQVLALAKDIKRYRLHVSDPFVVRKFEQAMDKVFHDLAVTPAITICHVALSLLEVLDSLGLELDNWDAQNIVFALIHDRPLPAYLQRRHSPRDEAAPTVASVMNLIAERLKVSTEPISKTLGFPPVHSGHIGGSSEHVMIRPS